MIVGSFSRIAQQSGRVFILIDLQTFPTTFLTELAAFREERLVGIIGQPRIFGEDDGHRTAFDKW